jgi:hypothetical protein
MVFSPFNIDTLMHPFSIFILSLLRKNNVIDHIIRLSST